MTRQVQKQESIDQNRRAGGKIYSGTFIAEVMDNKDMMQKAGRLWVFIPEFGGVKTEPSAWVCVSYASPFYGISPHLAPSAGASLGSFSDQQAVQERQQQQEPPVTTYGFWAIPPDVGVRVLCTFVDGETSQGFWFAVVPTVSHGMVPAIGAPDGKTPMADFNPLSPEVLSTTDLSSIQRQPYEPLIQQLTTQGLQEDPIRGPITSSSFRESPSRVFGISSQSTPEAPGHTFVMDDGGEDGKNKLIRLRTSSGNQITMHDDTGMIYLINSQGTGWIELSPSGQIDVFGAAGINMATNGDINFHADKNVNIHAGNCVKIVGMVGTKVMGGEELQLHGKKTMIEGIDSLHVHSCTEMMFTSFGDIHMKAFNYFCLKGKCFYWNSCTAKEAEQVPPEAIQEVSGYQTTVARAPSKEPYKEHDGGQGAGGGAGGGTGATGGGGSGTDAGGMFGGTSGEGPAALNNPVTASNAAVPSNSIQLSGGTLADAGGLSGLANVSGINSPFRSNTGGINTPLNSASSMGTSFNGIRTNPQQVSQTSSTTSLATALRRTNQSTQGNYFSTDGETTLSWRATGFDAAGRATSVEKTVSNYSEVTRSYTTQQIPGTSQDVAAFNEGILNQPSQSTLDNITTGSPVGGSLGNEVSGSTAPLDPAASGREGRTESELANPDQNQLGQTPAQEASEALGQSSGQSPSSDLPAAPGGGDTGCFAKGDNCDRPVDQTGGGGGGGGAQGGQKNFVPPDSLKNDPEFQAKLAEMKAKYPGLTDQQIYNVIGGESGFNFAAVNSQSGATGAFQFLPSTAQGLGYSTAQIQAMSPAQQLAVYDKYLSSNGYRGGALGIMQAAPAFAGRPGNTIVYGRGTAAWNQNPGWRGSDGNITVDSINRYYGY